MGETFTGNIEGETPQERAIFLARQEGERIAKEHPEIREEYLSGLTYELLAMKYLPNITKLDVATSAIGFAIRELIDEGTRMEMSRVRQERIGRENGERAKKMGTGFFGMSTSEKQAHQKKASRAANYSMGKTPYEGERKTTEFGEMNEAEYVSHLALSENFLGYEEITNRTNKIYGNNRTRGSITQYGTSLKRRLKKQ